MDHSQEPIFIEVEAPSAMDAKEALRAYMSDVAGRYHGRQATDEEIAAALHEDPSHDLALPHGIFLVARRGGDVLGCAGLRLLPGRLGEIKRVSFSLPLAAAGLVLGSWQSSNVSRLNMP